MRPIAVVVFALGLVGPAAPQDAPATGVIKGRAVLKGELPKMKKIPMGEKQAECHGEGKRYETEVVNAANRGIKNVFVRVKAGLPARKRDVPKETVTVTQKECTYVPRVAGLMIGQTFAVTNQDGADVTHNIKSSHFNWMQSDKIRRHETTFAEKEEPLRVGCEIHGWMVCWVWVLDHPYFAVTDADGAWTLPALPPGEYEIAAWQETYGEFAVHKIKVAAGETKEIDLVYERK